MDGFWCSPKLIIADNIVKYPVDIEHRELTTSIACP